jgi:hypothetical protein
MQPRYAHPVAHAQRLNLRSRGHDLAHDLVSRNDSREVGWQIALHHVKVRPANAALIDPDENLTFSGDGCLYVFPT